MPEIRAVSTNGPSVPAHDASRRRVSALHLGVSAPPARSHDGGMAEGDVAGREPGEPARGGVGSPSALDRLLAIGAEAHALRRVVAGLAEEAEALLRRAAVERAAAAREREQLIRERDAALAEARRAVAETTSRQRAVDYILGIVGHDLRNPLGAIHMSAALLQKRGALEGWQARTVDRMRSSAGRMARIIADLLSYTRTRLGNGLPIDRREARLDEIARRAVDELSAANPEREIRVAADGDLAGVWDPDRLEQLVSNLVSNALDHGDGAAPVRVELAGDPEACVLRVCNRGPAMPPEVRDHLFEPFSRPPDEKSRKGSGLGLGLFISREIVRGHGGEISIASDAPEGGEGETVITVRLPRRAG